ncbi:hypothetical protein SLEP1_g37696 [Rubroshorea leprosula]|uniref:Uncharacterized protein n=1 Tax=Rubroshorea leprosula TaxID=152421 RepID=A0AAV5KVG4_9ROSI|nr:hypothetical protein SLEP1_g37696 [Rubroshorea leprosula]
MSDQYENVNEGRLTFKGDSLATRKTIDKKKQKKRKHKNKNDDECHQSVDADAAESGAGEQTYTIDAAKRMKYEDLFPVESKKFGYDSKNANAKSVKDALDDRVKKNADRYCK